MAPKASSSSTTNHSRWSRPSGWLMASNMARRIQAAIIERSAAICAGLVGNEQHARQRSRPHPVAHRKRRGALALDVLERRDGGSGHGANRAEHARVVGIEKGLRRRAGDDRPQLLGRRHGQQAPQIGDVAPAADMAAPHHGGQKSARIAAPLARRRIIAGRDQAARQLLDVVAVLDLARTNPISRNRARTDSARRRPGTGRRTAPYTRRRGRRTPRDRRARWPRRAVREWPSICRCPWCR